MFCLIRGWNNNLTKTTLHQIIVNNLFDSLRGQNLLRMQLFFATSFI